MKMGLKGLTWLSWMIWAIPILGFSHGWICGDAFKSLCQHVLDPSSSFQPEAVREGDRIFVRGSYLQHFFFSCHPKINCRYILFTHNFPTEIPGTFSRFLQDSKLMAWFASNLTIKHPKMFPLPLGIQNRDLSAKRDAALEKWHELASTTEKKIFLYLNFSDETFKERAQVRKLFEGRSFCVSSPRKPFEKYFQDLAQSRFVLSPRGFGIDCFRTWEAILLGAIPIVRSSPLDHLFEDLPVLIVNDWDEIDETFLLDKEKEIRAKPIAWEKLHPAFWITALEWIR